MRPHGFRSGAWSQEVVEKRTMWDRFGKIATIATILGFIIALILFFEQSKTFLWVTDMLSTVISPSLLKVVLAFLILLLLSISLWRQRLLKEQLEDQSNRLKKIEQRGRNLYIRELITASHLEGTTIVLMHSPIPNTVHLFITSMIYVPETSRGMVLKGRKIFLEDIQGDVHFATYIHEWVTERSVAVEYLRDLSTEEIRD